MPDRDVMLAFPHPGEVKTEFMMSAFDACAGDTRVAELREFRTGPAMANARNQMTRIFLNSVCEWLWMVDADMIFSARTLPALLEAADPKAMPVVAALCFVQVGPYTGEQIPNMYHATKDEDGKFIFKSYERFPLGVPVQVGATGAGCILIHRDVFKRAGEADPGHEGLWWAETIAGGTLIGEDFSFCMRCQLAGIPVYVHTGVQVGHTKSHVLGEVKP